MYKVGVLIFSAIIILLSIRKLVQTRKEEKRGKFYLFFFTLISTMAIAQTIAIDFGVIKKYPFLSLFYIPYHQISLVIFLVYTTFYLNRVSFLKKYILLLCLPFLSFLILNLLRNINFLTDYSFLSEETRKYLDIEWSNSFAVLYSIVIIFIIYHQIIAYERSIGTLPFETVVSRTKWIKTINLVLLTLYIVWGGVMLYEKISPNLFGYLYCPIWILFLLLFSYILFFDVIDLNNESIKKESSKKIEGLNRIFDSQELERIENSSFQTTEILSFFATSLFDKNNTEDVLWSIVENCVSKLELEDAIIYLLDKDKQNLVQKVAFGNKQEKYRTILSPISIPIGQGIVGAAALNKAPEVINDINSDSRYIIDDLKRNSELAVPILFENKLIGVIDSEHSQENFFQNEHLLIFSLIAKLTAIKLNQIQEKNKLTLTNDNAYFADLKKLMQQKKRYRNPNINLTSVAEELSISSNYLSQLINQINQTSFPDFINSYRVEDAKKMLINSEFKNYTITAIGLEAGFNSKTAFYNSFKKSTGKTPTAYREENL